MVRYIYRDIDSQDPIQKIIRELEKESKNVYLHRTSRFHEKGIWHHNPTSAILVIDSISIKGGEDYTPYSLYAEGSEEELENLQKQVKQKEGHLASIAKEPVRDLLEECSPEMFHPRSSRAAVDQ